MSDTAGRGGWRPPPPLRRACSGTILARAQRIEKAAYQHSPGPRYGAFAHPSDTRAKKAMTEAQRAVLAAAEGDCHKARKMLRMAIKDLRTARAWSTAKARK